MKSIQSKDMTKGSPWKRILHFAVPACLGLMFQQFYSMVDTMLVGRVLGVESLAGVGSTGYLNFMVVYFCIGICSGFAIPVAQMFGAGKEEELRRFVANSIWLGAALAGLLTGLVSYFCQALLTGLRTPDDIFQYAYDYILIIFLGLPCTFLYNLPANISRALGDSRTPLLFLVFSSVLNIGLDILFLLPMGMGVQGAAWATVISQGVSGLFCLFYVRRKFMILRFGKDDWKIRYDYVKRLALMGLPMGLQYSITGIGIIVIQFAVNQIGVAAVAGVTAAEKLYSLFVCPLEALGETMAPYAGQNMGAGRPERIRQGAAAASVCGFIWSAVCIPLLYFGGKPLTMLFVDGAEHEVIAYAFQFLMVSIAGFAILTLVYVLRFTLQGMGFSGIAMMGGVLEMFARLLAGFVLAPRMGFMGICISHPLAWLAADLLLFPAFLKHGKDRNKRPARLCEKSFVENGTHN
ncbi:MAG: MATE family efflux transporter [Lachnospiraceae bacterium]|nr:MATE family efflux transporter [Lachnospiraceae bacterium]